MQMNVTPLGNSFFFYVLFSLEFPVERQLMICVTCLHNFRKFFTTPFRDRMVFLSLLTFCWVDFNFFLIFKSLTSDFLIFDSSVDKLSPYSKKLFI